jgi:hypothetical protein
MGSRYQSTNVLATSALDWSRPSVCLAVGGPAHSTKIRHP